MVLIQGLGIWLFGSALLGLPALVAGGSVYVLRRRLARPWTVFLASTLVLYALVGIAAVWFLPAGALSMGD